MKTLPVLRDVSPARLRHFMEQIDGEEITEHKGRCITVRCRGLLPAWEALFETLMGPASDVEEFSRPYANTVCARLLTDQQVEARDAAWEADETLGDLRDTFPVYGVNYACAAASARAPRARKLRKSGKKTISALILRCAEEMAPISLIDFIAAVKRQIPEDRNKRGDDRRED